MKATERIFMCGEGGHACVVSDVAELSGFIAVPYDERRDAPFAFPNLGVVAIGDNALRKKVFQKVEEKGKDACVPLIHPLACVSSKAMIGGGTVIMAGGIVQPRSIIGRNVIINSNASVDHDCRIGDYAHIAPGVTLCGSIEVGEGALLGVGTRVTPGVKIGAWAFIKAGSVVTRDVREGYKGFVYHA